VIIKEKREVVNKKVSFRVLSLMLIGFSMFRVDADRRGSSPTVREGVDHVAKKNAARVNLLPISGQAF
jgi:hypothetical protein